MNATVKAVGKFTLAMATLAGGSLYLNNLYNNRKMQTSVTQDTGFLDTTKSMHEISSQCTLHYVSTKASGDIDMGIGEAIIFHTADSYANVPAFLYGKMEVKAKGDITLEVVTQNKNGELVFNVADKKEREGKFIPATILYARKRGTSDLTVKFIDMDEVEKESSKYKVIVH